MQYLEGPVENIKLLMESIAEDKRHEDIEIRAKGTIEHRIFREWSMGSWLMPKRKFIELSGLYDIKRFLDSGKHRPVDAFVYIELFHDILRTWIEEEKKIMSVVSD